jgi:hypothetical protein
VPTLDLTPARLRVLAAAADRHINVSDLAPNRAVHQVPDRTSCRCNLRHHEIVTRQIGWLAENELVWLSQNRVWVPTEQGFEALNRAPF